MKNRAGLLSVLALGVLSAGAADWSSLDARQHTITRAKFDELLATVYAPQGGIQEYLEYASNAVAIFSTAEKTGAPLYCVEFANVDAPPTHVPPSLASLRICLDPGHIGGAWARTEERFFFSDRNDWYVQEAALNLLVARLLKERLEALGAHVFLTKDDFNPVTDKRPGDFEAETVKKLGDYEHFMELPELFREAARLDSIRKRSELAFFRASEIEARAKKVNVDIKPDVTVCIHFNARDTDDPHELIEDNGLAVFIHGNYLPAELQDDEQKLFLFRKLLEGTHDVELALARSVTDAMIKETKLGPAYHVTGGGMFPAGSDSYLYARNLAASRQYAGPVIFLEPYFMNNRIVYARIQAGDFEGEREIEGAACRSIFREYADAVLAGVTNFFK